MTNEMIRTASIMGDVIICVVFFVFTLSFYCFTVLKGNRRAKKLYRAFLDGSKDPADYLLVPDFYRNIKAENSSPWCLSRIEELKAIYDSAWEDYECAYRESRYYLKKWRFHFDKCHEFHLELSFNAKRMEATVLVLGHLPKLCFYLELVSRAGEEGLILELYEQIRHLLVQPEFRYSYSKDIAKALTLVDTAMEAYKEQGEARSPNFWPSILQAANLLKIEKK
jgi:hypothetical protein